MKSLFTILFLYSFSIIWSQLPMSDIYLAELKNISTTPKISSVKYLNDFNTHGYNNQARFFTYNDIYFAASMDTTNKTDIYHLDIKTQTMSRVTDTENISEFSPTPMPIEGQFSVVRIEADGKTQSLWQYPIDRSSKGVRLLKDLDNVGYHAWLSEQSVALFLVGKENTLAIANIKTQKTDIILDNIGRCLKIDNDKNLVFVHKIRPDLWLLKKYDTKDKAISTICQLPAKSEDFDIMSNGKFIIGDGSKIKIFDKETNTDWVEIADFSLLKIDQINRISVFRDRIAFVNNQ